jgi:alpha-tubulin suppressor-like RCC1 family protein
VSFEHFKSSSIKISRVACGYAISYITLYCSDAGFSYKHTLAMTEIGAAFSCGCNAQGQLGVKSIANRVLFERILYLQKEDIVSITAGARHRCFFF